MKKYDSMFAGFLILLFTLSFPSGLFAEEGHMHEKMEHGKKSMKQTEENIVIDPVCGMKIEPEDAAGKSEYKGTTYYFCMDADKETFDQDPEKYIAGMKEGEPAGEMNKHHEMEGHDHEMFEKKERGEHKMEGHHEMMHGSHWMAPKEEAAKPNPVAATEASIARGKELYVEKCAICHGQGGGGDGALAASLEPKPADLTGTVTRMHPDGDLFYKISKGKGVMPAWEPTLSGEDRWNLVNFIRSLSK
jgi:YHS domain-containing protein/cytochrome c5